MGETVKMLAKGWFVVCDIFVLVTLLHGQFSASFAILVGAAITAGALWLFGEFLERLEYRTFVRRGAAVDRSFSPAIRRPWSPMAGRVLYGMALLSLAFIAAIIATGLYHQLLFRG